jgi:hypothetical protein
LQRQDVSAGRRVETRRPRDLDLGEGVELNLPARGHGQGEDAQRALERFDALLGGGGLLGVQPRQLERARERVGRTLGAPGRVPRERGGEERHRVRSQRRGRLEVHRGLDEALLSERFRALSKARLRLGGRVLRGLLCSGDRRPREGEPEQQARDRARTHISPHPNLLLHPVTAAARATKKCAREACQ